MSIERNIIFIYPISKTLKDLKDVLDQEGDAVVYELDSVGEYMQIIGIVEHSITFSSDIKKTEGYLRKCKKILKKPTNKNYLIQEKNVPAQMFTRYQRAGLNEVVLEGASAKSLKHKINMFFSPFEQALKKEEEAKNKAVMGSMSIQKDSSKNEKDADKSNERQRVEKTVDISETFGELRSSKKSSGFALDAMTGGSGTTNFDLKKSNTDLSMLASPFDKMQRKKVAQFEAVDAKKKLQKSNFEPIVGELKKGAKKALDIAEAGEIGRKKSKNIQFEEAELKKKKVNFEEHLAEMNKKKINLDLDESELKKKRVDFEELLSELERKKKATFEETEIGRKKKKQFEEFHEEMKKKKVELDLTLDDLKKKKVNFEEVELDLTKKRKKFEEETLDLKKKRAILEELEGLKKKKAAMLEEHLDLERKKKHFEEVMSRASIKKLKFPDPEELDKKKGKDLELEDFNKKKGKNFEEVELKKKKLKFEEVELDLEKKKQNFDEVNELNNKDNSFKEVEKEGKQHGQIDLPGQDNTYKHSGFEEVPREGGFASEQLIGLKKEITLDTDMDFGKKKEYEEQTIDYGDFKKDKKAGQFAKEQLEEERRKQKELQDLLDEPEYKFFENESFGLEYLILHNDFLLKETTTGQELFKFIHFALMKSYDADISFYLVKEVPTEEVEEYRWSCLYSGHRKRKNMILENDFDRFEAINIQEWLQQAIPFWKDETFQIEVNEFIYPYFEDGELLGVAVSHFKNTIKDHSDASKAELLCMCLKGVILEEFDALEKS